MRFPIEKVIKIYKVVNLFYYKNVSKLIKMICQESKRDFFEATSKAASEKSGILRKSPPTHRRLTLDLIEIINRHIPQM